MNSVELVYYKSDFTLFIRMKDCAGEALDSADFEIKFFTDRSTTVYTAACKSGGCKNCIRENDGFRFIFNSHNLYPGTLRYEAHYYIPDPHFPDGIRDLFRKGTLNVQLTKEDVGCPDAIEVEIMAPFIKGKDGKSLTYDDLSPEQKADLVSHFDPESIGISSEEYSAEDINRIAEEALAELESESKTEQHEGPGKDPRPKA